MNTIKQTYKLLLVALFSTAFASLSYAQERKDSFEKTYAIKSTGDFTFSCYDADLKVNTWQKNEIKIQGEIIIEGGSKEDQEELIQVFKNPQVSKSASTLSIETNLAKNTVIIGPYRRTTLVNNKTVKVNKYKVNYTLWVPESIHFNLTSKYNNIDIANLTGKIDFELYDADLTMLGYGNDSKLEMKYSSASLGKGGDALIDIYDSELEALEMGHVEIHSKYSEIEIQSINTLDFNSYDDDLRIGKINSLKSEAKYSDYTIENDMENCLIDFYDSDITTKNINTLVFSGKYSSVNALNTNTVNINLLYDSDVKLGHVKSFSCNESKYDEIKLESISKSVVFGSAFELNLDINNVSESFELFKGEFKYGSIQLPLDPSLQFSIKFNTTYGSVDFPKNRVKINDMNFEDSNKSFEGQTSDNPKCKIEFTGYDTDFDLE